MFPGSNGSGSLKFIMRDPTFPSTSADREESGDSPYTLKCLKACSAEFYLMCMGIFSLSDVTAAGSYMSFGPQTSFRLVTGTGLVEPRGGPSHENSTHQNINSEKAIEGWVIGSWE